MSWMWNPQGCSGGLIPTGFCVQPLSGGPEGFPGDSVVKNLPSNAGATVDAGLIPRSGRSPGIGNGNPLKYSCLGNPMDSAVWWGTVHGVTRVRHNWAPEPTQRPCRPLRLTIGVTEPCVESPLMPHAGEKPGEVRAGTSRNTFTANMC